MSILTGKTVGGYQIMEEIGRGGMGVVFKAQQLSMDRIVAIKFLPQKLAGEPKIVARFLREARAAGKLSHPNIVSVHDAGVADGLHYIAMELVEGTSCYRRIKMLGAYTEKEALTIGGQMAEALRYAHSKNILHRDIKPDNFLADSTGRVRLADLGLARFVGNDGGDTELTQEGTTMGTPYYMSPEQCKGMGVDARSDIYSLGASMYMLACGTPPYREAKALGAGAVLARVLTEPPVPMLQYNPKLSPAYVALVEKLMHRDPEKRFASAEEVVKAIERCRLGQSVAAPAGKMSSRSAAGRPRISTFKQVVIGAVCAIVFIVVLAKLGNRNRNANNAPNDSTEIKTGPAPDRERSDTTKQAALPPAPIVPVGPVGPVGDASTETKSGDGSIIEIRDTDSARKEAEATRKYDVALTAKREKNMVLARELANDLILKFAETKFVQSHLKEINNLTLP